MAEFENGYCTGCGYKVRRWGHRPYCWRVVCHQLAHLDPTISTVVKRCLHKMKQHHRFVSLFLAREKHMYYTVESIEKADAHAG